MKRSFVVVLIVLFTACGQPADIQQAQEPVGAQAGTLSTTTAPMANTAPEASATYQEARDSAVATVSLAAEKNSTWSTSDALLKQAEAASIEGELDRAIQLADEARWLAELAIKQAETEETLWRDRVLRN